LGHFSNEGIIVDEAELQCYQHLQNLYNSTRAAKVQLFIWFGLVFLFLLRQNFDFFFGVLFHFKIPAFSEEYCSRC